MAGTCAGTAAAAPPTACQKAASKQLAQKGGQGSKRVKKLLEACSALGRARAFGMAGVSARARAVVGRQLSKRVVLPCMPGTPCDANLVSPERVRQPTRRTGQLREPVISSGRPDRLSRVGSRSGRSTFCLRPHMGIPFPGGAKRLSPERRTSIHDMVGRYGIRNNNSPWTALGIVRVSKRTHDMGIVRRVLVTARISLKRTPRPVCIGGRAPAQDGDPSAVEGRRPARAMADLQRGGTARAAALRTRPLSGD